MTGMDEARLREDERRSLWEASGCGGSAMRWSQLIAVVERILAAHVAAARAEAWDYLRGVLDQESELERADNPYRETTPATMSPEQARRILARSKPTEIRMPAGPSIPPEPTP